MDEECRRTGSGKRGRDLARNMARLANSRYNNPLTASDDHLDRFRKGGVDNVCKAKESFSLHRDYRFAYLHMLFRLGGTSWNGFFGEYGRGRN